MLKEFPSTLSINLDIGQVNQSPWPGYRSRPDIGQFNQSPDLDIGHALVTGCHLCDVIPEVVEMSLESRPRDETDVFLFRSTLRR